LTFHFAVAGVGSTFPAASIARIWMRCFPSLTLNFELAGQLLNFSSSRAHSKVEPGSLEETENLALRLVVLRSVFLSIVV
jgi:hypothetical protein